MLIKPIVFFLTFSSLSASLELKVPNSGGGGGDDVDDDRSPGYGLQIMPMKKVMMIVVLQDDDEG